MRNRVYTLDRDFILESGERIERLQIAYQTFGTLNRDRSNVVWVFHALSANADVMAWWPGLFGKHDYFNPEEHFIVCANVIGSPYGSTAPKNLDFPFFTVRDIVKAELLLAKHLGIQKIFAAIGGSFGGSQALEFAYSFKGNIDHLILIACAAKESAWGIAIHETQRMAMKTDPSFGQPNGGGEGIRTARAIGMLTYRTQSSFESQQTNHDDRVDDFDASSYIQYQGKKFEDRFDALSYYYLSKCLDTHNLGRGRGGVQKALGDIRTKTLVIGIDSDHLLPNYQQKEIVAGLSNGKYREIQSEYGHDGFLIETKKLTIEIKDFIRKSLRKETPVKALNNNRITKKAV